MIEFSVIALGFGLKVIGAIVAFVLARFALKNLDKVIGFNFKSWVETADDRSLAIYTGCRILAICILIGFIVSG